MKIKIYETDEMIESEDYLPFSCRRNLVPDSIYYPVSILIIVLCILYWLN